MGSGKGQSKRTNLFLKKKKEETGEASKTSSIQKKIDILNNTEECEVISGSIEQGEFVIKVLKRDEFNWMQTDLLKAFGENVKYLREDSIANVKVNDDSLVFHAEGKPAIANPDGGEVWMKEGNLHRLSGRADYNPNYKQYIYGYAINGEKMQSGKFIQHLRAMENPYENTELMSAKETYAKGFGLLDKYLAFSGDRKLGVKEINKAFRKKSYKFLDDASYSKLEYLNKYEDFRNGFTKIIENDISKNGEITGKITEADRKRLMSLNYKLREYIIVMPTQEEVFKDIFGHKDASNLKF